MGDLGQQIIHMQCDGKTDSKCSKDGGMGNYLQMLGIKENVVTYKPGEKEGRGDKDSSI